MSEGTKHKLMRDTGLECRHLMKSFGGVRAINDLSVSFEPGRVTALIGPNAAGKTTLFHMLTGALRPDSGEVIYNGERIDHLQTHDIVRRGVGRLFQDIRTFGKMSVLENVLVAAPDQPRENPLCALLGPRWFRGQEAHVLARAVEWLSLVGLGDEISRPAEELSWGQQRLLAMARLVACDVDVLLLDEPTAGVSPAMIPRLLQAIKAIRELGKMVVVIEHNMSVVLEVADWVNFLDAGRLVAFGLPDEVLGDHSVRAAYLGV